MRKGCHTSVQPARFPEAGDRDDLDELLRRHHEQLWHRLGERLDRHQEALREAFAALRPGPAAWHLSPGFSAGAGPGSPCVTPRGLLANVEVHRSSCRASQGQDRLSSRRQDAEHPSVLEWTLPGSVDSDLPPCLPASPSQIFPPESEPPLVASVASEELTPELAYSKESLLLRGKLGPRRKSQDMWRMKIHNKLLLQKQTTRVSHYKPADVLTAHTKRSLLSKQGWLTSFVFSDKFDLVSSILIIVNCVFIAAQIEYITLQAEKTGKDVVPSWSMPIELVFCCVFFLEFAMRVWAYGRRFFRSQDWAWNLFDGIVVFASFFEVSLDLISDSARVGNTSFFHSIRALRTTKAIRIVRVLRFFKDLRMLVSSILGSFKALIWSAVMMILMWYVYGVILTTTTYEACTVSADPLHEDCKELNHRFGTLSKSVLSLYMSMSGGVDWDDIYQAMDPIAAVYKYLLLIYLFFTMFGVLNIVTGIFVESAKEAGQNDRDTLVRAQLRYQDRYLKDMIRLFQEIDTNGSGIISREEFQAHLFDERALAYFEALKLDISDVATLFDLLDTNKSGGIDQEEFLAGCQKLRGEARALDLAVMRFELLSWMGHFSTIFDTIEQQLQELGKSIEHFAGQSNRRGRVMTDDTRHR